MATALRTPPHPILVSHADDGAGIRELAQTIARKDPEAPGVTGIEPGVTRFTDVWASLRAVRPHRLMRQGVYSIDHVAQDPEVEGAHRPARVGDFELLVDWAMAFHQETEPWSSAVTIDSVVRRRLETDDRLGGFWLWVVEGIPVCLSGYAGPTPNGIRIGPVYTPPDLRGHGYATALVTAQTHWLLKGGRKFCSLYTDLSNQVTNRIYRSIGFRLVGESAEYSFTSRQG